jgi:hypothetical protein
MWKIPIIKPYQNFEIFCNNNSYFDVSIISVKLNEKTVIAYSLPLNKRILSGMAENWPLGVLIARRNLTP